MFGELQEDVYKRQDYNHPCVAIYSIGNEISELGTTRGVETVSYTHLDVYKRQQMISMKKIFEMAWKKNWMH